MSLLFLFTCTFLHAAAFASLLKRVFNGHLLPRFRFFSVEGVKSPKKVFLRPDEPFWGSSGRGDWCYICRPYANVCVCRIRLPGHCQQLRKGQL